MPLKWSERRSREAPFESAVSLRLGETGGGGSKGGRERGRQLRWSATKQLGADGPRCLSEWLDAVRTSTFRRGAVVMFIVVVL